MNADEFVRAAREGGEELIEVGKRLAEEAEGEDRARVLGTLGNLYFDLGKFDEAEEAYLEALQEYIRLSEEKPELMRYVAACLYNLGNLYQMTRRFGEAEKAYLDALRTLEYVDDTPQRVHVLAALGTMYAKLGRYDKAQEVLFEAIKDSAGIDNRTFGVVLNNLAVVLRRMERREEGKMLLQKALEVFEKDDARLLVVLQNLVDEDMIELAEKYSGKSYALDAKVKYLKAKKADGEEAARLYLEAGCLGFLAYRNQGMATINFIYCLERAAEHEVFRHIADGLKRIIMKCYYGADVDVSEAKVILNAEVENEIVRETIRTIADDISSGRTFRGL